MRDVGSSGSLADWAKYGLEVINILAMLALTFSLLRWTRRQVSLDFELREEGREKASMHPSAFRLVLRRAKAEHRCEVDLQVLNPGTLTALVTKVRVECGECSQDMSPPEPVKIGPGSESTQTLVIYSSRKECVVGGVEASQCRARVTVWSVVDMDLDCQAVPLVRTSLQEADRSVVIVMARDETEEQRAVLGRQKAKAVRKLLRGAPIGDLARELGVCRATIRKWEKEFTRAGCAVMAPGLPSNESGLQTMEARHNGCLRKAIVRLRSLCGRLGRSR